MHSVWLAVVMGVAGCLGLAVVLGVMALSLLPSPTTRALYKRWESWRRQRRRADK